MEHFQARVTERLLAEYDANLDNCIRSLKKKAKARQIPNGKWFKAVRANGTIVAYIVGKGTTISSLLKGTMVPQGVEI